MAENNTSRNIIEKVTGFDCALKIIGYAIILMLVNSCIDKISESKLKEQEKFYKEIMQQQCKERIGEKIIETIKELSVSNNPNATEGIQSIKMIHQQLLEDCNSVAIKDQKIKVMNAK